MVIFHSYVSSPEGTIPQAQSSWTYGDRLSDLELGTHPEPAWKPTNGGDTWTGNAMEVYSMQGPPPSASAGVTSLTDERLTLFFFGTQQTHNPYLHPFLPGDSCCLFFDYFLKDDRFWSEFGFNPADLRDTSKRMSMASLDFHEPQVRLKKRKDIK